MSARYFDLIREMKRNTYNHRLLLVESAKQRGIKPTVRAFATTAPTVRKWLRRFQQHGPSGLSDFFERAKSIARTRNRLTSLAPPSAFGSGSFGFSGVYPESLREGTHCRAARK